MTNSNQLFELAQLAEASYAEFDKFSNDIIGALKAKNFSKTQAEDFADNWAVVDHQPNTGNGYSGTLFEYIGDDPNSGFTQGQQVFAQRGTEPTLEDASADIHEISQNGLAFRQIIDMYNYWQRLIAADGATVSEARLVVADIVNLPMDKIIFESIVPGSPFGAYWTIDFEDVAGAGLGKVNTSNLAGATGHSLGGHLADAFSRLFGAEALTTNGAGYATGLLPGLGLTAGYNIPNLFAMLGGADKFPAQYINNLFGDKMPEFVTQNGPGLYQAGGHNALFIEQDSWYENTLGHGSSQMTDSLAVANLFIKLDASLATQAPAQVLTILNSLMEKSSNQVAQSLEKLVESLSEILLGNKPTITTDDRESLYVAIKAITDNPVFTALAGKVTLSATIPSTSEARNDLSAFLSLYYLTPFTLKESVAGVLDSIYMNHGTLAQQWNDDKDLTPEQIANGEANFSDMYLNDRAAMLSWVNKRNKKDDNKTVLDDTAPNALFRDKNGGQNAQGTSLYTTEIRLGSGGDENRQHFIFGANDDADTLTGSSQADHLYGMAGADTLNGDKGNDWLEGGADNDTLNGGEDNDSLYGGTGDDKLFGDAGNDHLYGGTDNDTLKGGKGADQLNGGDGNDTLEGEEDNDIIKGGDGHDKLTGGKGQDYLYGGDGNDTYTHNAGDGTDVIIDSDGQGSIKIKGGTTLNGGAKKEGTDNVWQSADKETQYALHDQGDGKYTLNILLDNGEKIFVKDWVNNQLGINLEDGTPPDVAVLTPASDYYEGKDADAQQDGGDGNDVLVASTHEKATLKGGAGNDLILGTGNGFSATLYNEDKSDSVTLQTNDDWKDINASWAIDQKGRGDNVYYYAGSPYTTTFWKITGTDLDFPRFSRQLIMSEITKRKLNERHQIYGRV
ncbi:MAG: calcium-binding protein [Methylotenera sp.]|nr:calcium-binding protein [Methylotenera sp.]